MASIPQDCVSEILSYLPEGGGATRQFRTEKPHIKEYLNSFCMRYTSSNLKYFNQLAERAPARGLENQGLAILIRAAEYVAMEETGRTIVAIKSNGFAARMNRSQKHGMSISPNPRRRAQKLTLIHI